MTHSISHPRAWLITPFAPVNILIDKSRFHPNDLIIAIDAGITLCTKYGISANIHIGDMDSLSETVPVPYHEGCETIICEPEKDETDTQLAVEYCISQQIPEIIIINDLTGRFDHSLGIIQNLLQAHKNGCKSRIETGSQTIFVLDNYNELIYPVGSTLSLISLSESAVFSSSTGLKYPLDGITLHQWQSKGISNLLTESKVEITIQSGIVLAIDTIKDTKT